MGFTLKKILSAFLMPISIGLVLLFVGLFYLYVKSYKKAKFYVSISFVWFLIISYQPLSNLLIFPLENMYPKFSSEKKVKYILLLGGDFKGRSPEVIRIYNKLENTKIITSGYPGFSGKLSEAEKSAKKLVLMGVPKNDIIMQKKPRDTMEEAMFVKEIVNNEAFILVTSAYHMPRAMEVFISNGLKPIPAPTNFLFKKDASWFSSPNAGNIYRSEAAVHEYFGLLWYWLKSFLN